jgi:non-heme chloroperoxidase
MPIADLGDIQLFYRESGSGFPVVFVHGVPTDYRVWDGQLDRFAREFRAIAYSRRFATPNTNAWSPDAGTVENNTADLVMLLKKLGLDSVVLVGHSYGGLIALYLAATTPRLVRSLVLVEPAVPTLLVRNVDSRLQMLSFLLRSPSVAFSASRFASRHLNPAISAVQRGDFEEAARLFIDGLQGDGGFHRLGAAGAMATENARTIMEVATRSPPITVATARAIRTETLVVHGMKTQLWLRRIAEMLAATMPNAELSAIEDSAHFPHLENPNRFNEHVLSFLRKHSAPSSIS